MKAYQQLRRECLEYTSLLWALDETPRDPEVYLRRDDLVSSPPRRLSFQREQQLANDFAFIASCKDDSRQIYAVCVEEQLHEAGVIIRVACNTGDPSPAVQTLREIAKVMSGTNAPGISRVEVQQKLLRKIIESCQLRILGRLRSHHAPKTHKVANRLPMPPLLLETVRCCMHKAPNAAAAADHAGHMHSQTQAFHDAFKSIEGSAKPETRNSGLARILDLAHDYDTGVLIKVLELDRDIQPTLKEYLPKAIEKLARYFQISIDLTRAARTRKHSLLRNIIILGVQIPVFQPHRSITDPRSYKDVLSLAIDKEERRFEPRRKNPEKRYRERFSSPQTTWKVHAEVQILFHYEMNPPPVQPRIICASKLACFCCDLFIRSRGRFTVPGTHGKIYESWSLPSWSDRYQIALTKVMPALQTFSQALKDSIKLACTQAKKRPLPSESVVFPSEPWSSNSTVRPQSVLQSPIFGRIDSHQNVQTPPINRVASVTRSSPVVKSISTPSASRRSLALSAYSESIEPTVPPSCIDEDLQTSEHDEAHDYPMHLLPCGGAIDELVQCGTTSWVQADAMHLLFSIDQMLGKRKVSRGTKRWDAFSVHIEDVHPDAERKGRFEQVDPVVELETMELGRNYTLAVGIAASSKSMMLRYGSQEVVLSFAPPQDVPASDEVDFGDAKRRVSTS